MIYDINGTVDGETVIEASINLYVVVGVQVTPIMLDDDQWQIVILLEKGGQIIMILPEKACREFRQVWKDYHTAMTTAIAEAEEEDGFQLEKPEH